jgi:hypothetical protein
MRAFLLPPDALAPSQIENESRVFEGSGRVTGQPEVLGIHLTQVGPTCRVRGHTHNTICCGNLSQMDTQYALFCDNFGVFWVAFCAVWVGICTGFRGLT